MTDESSQSAQKTTNQFGTFGGVFTPSILTILGVILFMRSGYVTGQAGIGSAMMILGIATAITFLTGLSISAISTNTSVKGGGAYFLISRSLGPEFGGAIGLALFAAQAIAVPFYVLGFVEALTTSFPVAEPYFMYIGMATLSTLFIINMIGADWAIRTQYIVLSILVGSILTFLVGGIIDFEWARVQQNWSPGYTDEVNFWVVFAVFFPAVTGIDAGVNMSGDLKEPEKSIPKGTLTAILVGSSVYLLNIFISGGSTLRENLIADPFGSLLAQAGPLSLAVVAGVFAATLSSAMGSLLGAPRILQALARDEIFPGLGFFSKGTLKGDEPRRGLVLSYGLGLGVLFLAGSGGGGGALNAVAVVLSMFFLFAYGMTNAAAFIEQFSRNPSFRPRFQYFHWSTALIGGIGCIVAAFLIDAVAALVALAFVALVFIYISRRVLKGSFGDARRGYVFERVRANLRRLARYPQDPKNWRPTTLALSGNPRTRLTLMWYATWLVSGRGIVSMVNVIEGSVHEKTDEREEVKRELEEFLVEKKIEAYVEVIVGPSFDDALSVLLQAQSIGPLKPNMIVSGWPSKPRDYLTFARQLRTNQELGMSQVILVDHGLPEEPERIDVWWRGRDNGSLMVILAYLLTQNWVWARARIRLITMQDHGESKEEAEKKLEELLDAARIEADYRILPTGDFKKSLVETSGDADVVLLGFRPPSDESVEAFHLLYSDLVKDLPTTLIVSSAGHADVTS